MIDPNAFLAHPVARWSAVLFLFISFFIGSGRQPSHEPTPAPPFLPAFPEGHGSGGIITEAEIEAVRAAYEWGTAPGKGAVYAYDVADPTSVDVEVLAREGVHLLLALPSNDPNVIWNDAAIQEAARLLLAQRKEVWLANGMAADELVPLTVLYTFHDYPGTGKLNTTNAEFFRGRFAPGTSEAHWLHAFRKDIGADFMYVVVAESLPEEGTGWRFYGWQNIFLPRDPLSDLIPSTGGVLWSRALEGPGLASWSKLIVAHEMEGHGMGSCSHIDGRPNVDLMRSSTPWGPEMEVCAAHSFANAAYVAEHWPSHALPTHTDDLPDVADEVLLTSNYPNPFSHSTTITFTLSRPTAVRLDVFDLLGRHVTTLAEGERVAGTYTLPFDGHGLSSGVYFYRLVAGAHERVRPMTIQRQVP